MSIQAAGNGSLPWPTPGGMIAITAPGPRVAGAILRRCRYKMMSISRPRPGCGASRGDAAPPDDSADQPSFIDDLDGASPRRRATAHRARSVTPSVWPPFSSTVTGPASCLVPIRGVRPAFQDIPAGRDVVEGDAILGVDVPRPRPLADRLAAFRLELHDVARGARGPGEIDDDADPGGPEHGQLDVLRRRRDRMAQARAAIPVLVNPDRGPAGRDLIGAEASVGSRQARIPVGRFISAADIGRDVLDPHLDVGQRPARVVDDPARDGRGTQEPAVVGAPLGMVVGPGVTGDPAPRSRRPRRPGDASPRGPSSGPIALASRRRPAPRPRSGIRPSPAARSAPVAPVRRWAGPSSGR